MARFIALEWNDTEARLAVAGGRPGQVVFEHAFTVSLRPPDPTDETSRSTPGERIAAALAARGIGRLPALVAMGRGKLELRQLSMPPAPDDELPDLVRFQALREFGSMQSDWPLDFIPLDDDPEQPRTVLAAAVAPEQMRELDATCQAAGLKPSRVLLRPCAAAALYCRAQPAEAPGQVRLLIDLLGDEADLTVVRDQTVVFLRTARLPGDALESVEAAEVLESEIRRTMAAAQNLLKGQKVGSLLLFGTSLKHNGLRDAFHKKFHLPVEVYNPFADLKLKGDLRRNVPADSDRFAPLLGALVDEIQHSRHTLDFLHPRRAPEKTAQKNLVVGVGLAVAVLLVGLLLFNFMQKRSLQNTVKRLSAESTNLKKQVDKAEQSVKNAGKVAEWADEDVHWLAELQWLSEKAPPAQDVMFSQMILSPGQIKLKGFVKDLKAYEELQKSLNDERHAVKPGNTSRSDEERGYTYQFDSDVFIAKEEQ